MYYNIMVICPELHLQEICHVVNVKLIQMKISFASGMLLVLATVSIHSSAQLTVPDPEHYKVWGKANNKYELKTIRLSTGVSLQFVEQGSAGGTPVIFLHGITDSW